MSAQVLRTMKASALFWPATSGIETPSDDPEQLTTELVEMFLARPRP